MGKKLNVLNSYICVIIVVKSEVMNKGVGTGGSW